MVPYSPSMPGTQTPQNRQLTVVILGSPIRSGTSVEIHILGVHEQASSSGLISTIIASRDENLTLADLESDKSGALAVIEAGLVQLSGQGSRSLGFRSVNTAMRTIEQSRQACARNNC